MLSRRQALALLSGTALAPWVAAFEAAAAPLVYELKPASIGEGIWVVPGAQEAITTENGGAIANITLFDTEAGAVIIDTGPSRAYGEKLNELARTLTGKDVARVYLTHFHPDHVFGNQAFAAERIATAQGVADGLKALGEAFADAMYRTAGDWMRGTELVLPGTIIAGGAEDFGNRRIRALPMRGHTDADVVFFDEASGVLIAGDLVFLDRAPTTPHADIERWRISLANLGSIPCSLIVPGHGPAEASDRGIKQTADWLVAVEDLVRGAFEKGLDITEAIALELPSWSNSIALARYEYERTVMHLYPKFEAARWPRVDKKT
jgi:quinoprotein relay system zinc metallohydrolase 1